MENRFDINGLSRPESIMENTTLTAALLADSGRKSAAIASDDNTSIFHSPHRSISNLCTSTYQFWLNVYDHLHSHKAYVHELCNSSYKVEFNKEGDVTSIILRNFSCINEVVQHNVKWDTGALRNVSYGIWSSHFLLPLQRPLPNCHT